jgi:hypothetical protein
MSTVRRVASWFDRASYIQLFLAGALTALVILGLTTVVKLVLG